MPRSPITSTVLAVAAGGALGGTARYGVDLLAVTATGSSYWATVAVNVLGAFALGLFLGVLPALRHSRRRLQPFVAIGVLGSFTTFSTWMVESLDLVASGRHLALAAYLLGTLAAGVVAAVAGLHLGARLRPTSLAEQP